MFFTAVYLLLRTLSVLDYSLNKCIEWVNINHLFFVPHMKNMPMFINQNASITLAGSPKRTFCKNMYLFIFISFRLEYFCELLCCKGEIH